MPCTALSRLELYHPFTDTSTVIYHAQIYPKGSVALADRSGRETGWVTSPGRSPVFAGFRFPREVIAVAVRWYLRYGLSYRDAGELLAERGITVDHVTIY